MIGVEGVGEIRNTSSNALLIVEGLVYPREVDPTPPKTDCRRLFVQRAAQPGAIRPIGHELLAGVLLAFRVAANLFSIQLLDFFASLSVQLTIWREDVTARESPTTKQASNPTTQPSNNSNAIQNQTAGDHQPIPPQVHRSVPSASHIDRESTSICKQDEPELRSAESRLAHLDVVGNLVVISQVEPERPFPERERATNPRAIR